MYFNKNFKLYKKVSTFCIAGYYNAIFLDFSDKKYIEVNDKRNHVHCDNFTIDELDEELLILK